MNKNISIRDKSFVTKVAKALSVEMRLDILYLLNQKNYNVSELSEALNAPVSTIANHLKVLEESGLIETRFEPGLRGSQKLASIVMPEISISIMMDKHQNAAVKTHYVDMPVGNYYECDVYPPCGMVSDKNYIGIMDDANSFYLPNRHEAQLLWFTSGMVGYKFYNPLKDVSVRSIEFILECCSEAPGHRNDWLSDITVWINGRKISAFETFGDYGDRRGDLTPLWWHDSLTQYGQLMNIKIADSGCYINQRHVSSLTLKDLYTDVMDFKIGVKKDAKNVGGINIFGQTFGDYKQNIVMKINYV